MYKFCKNTIIIWSIFCVIGLFIGLNNVSKIKTTNEFEQAGAAIGTTIGVGFWISLWFFPTVGLGIIALLTRPKSQVEVLPAATLCIDCGKYYSGTPKYCPNCGKPISSNATLAPIASTTERKLGWRLVLGIIFLPYIFSWFTLRQGYSTTVRTISFSWMVLVLLLILTPSDHKYNSSSREESRNIEESVTTVGIHQLLSDYQNNEVAADNKYKGHLVQVTGIVNDIKKDILDDAYVTLGTGVQFEIPQVQAFFKKSDLENLGRLQSGQKLTIVGRVDGLMMNVLIRNSYIQ